MAKKTGSKKTVAKSKAPAKRKFRESFEHKKERVAEIVRLLRLHYPNAECALHFKNPLQLLLATILSAQCTDERVNMVTPVLFERFPTAKDLATAPVEEIEEIIRSTGFFKNKAKNIKACCQKLVNNFNSEVPQNLDALVQLPGVGRKTANVVLGTAFGIPSGVVVDTHVTRLTNRLGLAEGTDAVKLEQALMPLVVKSDWIDFSHLLIHHGRKICQARKPQCGICPLKDICPQLI